MGKKAKQEMIKIGRAMLALGLQNTHSGNISLRQGTGMYITKTNSMKGHLEERDIVEPGISTPQFGLFQASSETGLHKGILEYSQAVVHAHAHAATLISYLTDSMVPMDILGKSYLGEVPVLCFEFPVGSKEMEIRIPQVLKTCPAMIIKTHGPVTHGENLFKAFFLMSLVNYSAEILVIVKKFSLSANALQPLSFPFLAPYVKPKGQRATHDPELLKQFKRIQSDLFTMKLSPFHTGSLSVSDGKEMLFVKNASSPTYIKTDISRLLIAAEEDDFFIRLHQAVYQFTHLQAALFSHSCQGVAAACIAMNQGMDRLIPMDAEGGYLYPAIPIVLPDEPLKKIVTTAARYKMVLIAGMGVLAIGHTPFHCIHHNSSLENIALMRNELQLLEKLQICQNTRDFEDKRGKNW